LPLGLPAQPFNATARTAMAANANALLDSLTRLPYATLSRHRRIMAAPGRRLSLSARFGNVRSPARRFSL
jgi:hypothetical protein